MVNTIGPLQMAASLQQSCHQLMARGSEFPLASMSMLLLWETKVIELKKEFQVVVFRLDFDLLHEVMSCPEV